MQQHMKKSTINALAQLTCAEIRAAMVALTHYHRRSHNLDKPDGTWDRAGRFFPSAEEDAKGDLTQRIRTPSRSHPTSYWRAAHGLPHCAVLAGCDIDTVKLVAKALKESGLSERVRSLEMVDDLKATLLQSVLERKLGSANKSTKIRL